MDLKLMWLRYDGTCFVCGGATPARTTAWWDKLAKRVTCLTCRPADTDQRALIEPIATEPAPPHGAARTSNAMNELEVPPDIDHGVGGVSARQQHERRKARDDRWIEAKWGNGRIGRIAEFLSDEPQSTAAWAKGAEGERLLARRLTDDLADVAVVLHDRKVPNTRGKIDHLVIAPSGIWIVDAKNDTGKVEGRDVGGWFCSPPTCAST